MSSSAIDVRNSWCVGSMGAERLGHLSGRLFERIVESRNERGDEARSYLPWHSCDAFADRIQASSVPLSKNRILKDSEVLKQMRKAYWGGKMQPLGGVSIASKSMSIDVRAERRDLAVLDRAIELVRSTDASWEARFDSLVRLVVPLRGLGKSVREGGVGFSTHYAKGAVFLSIPRQRSFPHIELSINVAHEMGHQALMIYQAADRIIAGDLGQPVFSGVRKTNRPAIQSFHALVALTYMVEYTTMRLKKISALDAPEAAYLKQRHEILLGDLEVSIAAFEAIDLTLLGENLYLDAKAIVAFAKALP